MAEGGGVVYGGVVWEAPGAGLWTHDPSHFPAPLTGFVIDTGMPGSAEGFRAGFARYGHATLGAELAVVNGWAYGQRVPVDAAQLPEREEAARAAIEERRWRIDGERWYTVDRAKMLGDCRALQDVDPSTLDDSALVRHLRDALELQRQAHIHHFSHVAMLFVVGEWVVAAQGWGLPTSEAFALLAGSSPATAAAARDLAGLAGILRAAGVTEVESLEQVRAVSAAAAAALDAYLATYGWRTVGGFDVDARALIEMPEVIVTSIRTALTSPFEAVEPDVTPARDRVPEAERARFDDLLAEARYVYGIRDDDVAPCMWTRGLIRRALLDIGARLAARDQLRHRDDVLEAGMPELEALLQGASSPSADDLAARASQRHTRAANLPPPSLGTPTPRPSTELPPTVARVMQGMAAYGRPTEPASSDAGIAGTGVGNRPYTGTARVAPRVEDALARLEPGDVLVTAMTTPAFNSVLAVAGALVVEHGGLTSHSGIMARELGLPAVLEARGCMGAIPDGAQVEVDPAVGVVRIL